MNNCKTFVSCCHFLGKHVLQKNVTLNLYLGFFALMYNSDKGGNSLPKHLECKPQICTCKVSKTFHTMKQTQGKVKRFL